MIISNQLEQLLLKYYWIRILFLVRIWLSRGSSSPIYSGTGFAVPVTWGSCRTSYTVDGEPRENQILMRKRILIQVQKLFYLFSVGDHMSGETVDWSDRELQQPIRAADRGYYWESTYCGKHCSTTRLYFVHIVIVYLTEDHIFPQKHRFIT